MVLRAVVIVAAGYVTGRILTWVTGVGLWQLLRDAPELWLIVAGIPLATLAALVVPDRPWREPAAQPRVRGYIEPATMPAVSPPPSYAAVAGPQVVHHYHHHTHELVNPPACAPLPPTVIDLVEAIEPAQRAALPAPRPWTGQ